MSLLDGAGRPWEVDSVLVEESDGSLTPGAPASDVQRSTLDPDASAAIDALALWADVDLEFLPDTLSDGLPPGSPERAAASVLARWPGRVPFRGPEQGVEVAPWIVDEYGCGDAGFVALLKAELEGIHQLPPLDLLLEEDEHVERVPVDGWNRNQGVAGATEAEWADWFVDVHLEKQLKRRVDLGGLPSLADPLPGGACDDPAPPTVCTGPVKAAYPEKLPAQFQQAYTQWVPLNAGSLDNSTPARSLLALGRSEHEGTLHHDEQKWRSEVDYTSSQVLKAQPIDRDQISGTPRSTPPTVLAYDP